MRCALREMASPEGVTRAATVRRRNQEFWLLTSALLLLHKERADVKIRFSLPAELQSARGYS